MKISITLALFFISTLYGFSQDAQDVLKGERCQSGDIYFDRELNHRINNRSTTHVSMEDSVVLLVPRSYTIHVQAYNPLHYTHANGIKVSIDPVQTSVLKALGYIIDSEKSTVESKLTEELYPGSHYLHKSMKEENPFYTLKDEFDKIREKIEEDKSNKCLSLTKKLLALNFEKEIETRADLRAIHAELEAIKKAFDAIESELSVLKIKIQIKGNELSQKKELEFLTDNWQTYKYLIEGLERMVNAQNEQIKRTENLDNLLAAIDRVMDGWKNKSSIFEDKWYIIADRRNIDFGELHTLEISFETHEMKFDEKTEKITKDDPTKKVKRFRIRKFNRFVAELSAGSIYTFQNYPRYTTERNVLNEEIVAEADENKLERIELSTMLNFNIYLPNSSVLPFVQVGLGVNGLVPIGLLGAGLRFDVGKKRVFALSGGISITGIKELQDLNLGDIVKDNLEVENDIEYQVSPIKPYFGIQYNF